MTGRQWAATCAGGSVAAVVVASAWLMPVRSGPAPTGVVLITLDTTRADRLSPYGFQDISLPTLERLAREGVLFEQAETVVPLTLPAHTSLLTGLLPPHHGVRDNADAPLADSETTMAEVLQAQGFRTGAFVASVVLDPNRGLRHGFDQYSGVTSTPDAPDRRRRRGDEVVGDAIRWLDTVGASPFFLWAHLYDAHRPYSPPEPYRSRYASDPYLAEIAFADAQVGRLVDALDARHLLNRTVLIVTADHGESLGAHGERDHGIFVYEDVLHVPLIVRAPGLAPTRVPDVVRLIDVMPTALALLGVACPRVDGTSLVDLIRGSQRDSNLEAYAESLYPERLGWSPLHALRRGRFKLIEAPRPELYDLLEDPLERDNLYDERRATADDLATRLRALENGRDGTVPSRLAAVTPGLRQRLASLGYLTSAPGPEPGGVPLPDPKDCIGRFSGSDVRPSPQACVPLPPSSRWR